MRSTEEVSDVPKKYTAAAIAAGGALAATVAIVARRRPTDADGPAGQAASGWKVVTIERPEAEVLVDGALPAPLDELADVIEVRAEAAPGGRGTELAVRIRPDAADQRSADGERPDPGRLRAALREAKQLLEAGEVATNEPQPEGHRPSTPAGLLVDALSRRSPKEGIL
jgi:hypothetical protein